MSSTQPVLVKQSSQDEHAVSREDVGLPLDQSTGFSLPNNQQFQVLLKALSIHLAGQHLVIRVIRFSDSHPADHTGRRSVSGDNSGVHSEQLGGYTPLCTIVIPQVWRRDRTRTQRREHFRKIRRYFCALANLPRRRGTELQQKSTKIDKAFKFFSDMFGLKYLKNYVGEITFPRRLRQMLETEPTHLASVGAVEGQAITQILVSTNYLLALGDGLLGRLRKSPFIKGAITGCRLSKNGYRSQGFRVEDNIVLPRLRKKCHALNPLFLESHRYAVEEKKTRFEFELISQTLSVGALLETISTTFIGKCGERLSPRANIHSMVQEIRVLQADLDATEDEDEQRALEEDITGKILWTLWYGIFSEVERVLPEVVNYIREEGVVPGLIQIGRIIEGTHSASDDDQIHLRRVMADARAGISKHQLLLAARAARCTGKPGAASVGEPTFDS